MSTKSGTPCANEGECEAYTLYSTMCIRCNKTYCPTCTEDKFYEFGANYCIDCCAILMSKAMERVDKSLDPDMKWVLSYLKDISEGMGIIQ